MFIIVKKNLHGLFLLQNTPFKPLGETHIEKKFFLNHPNFQWFKILHLNRKSELETDEAFWKVSKQ